MFPTAQQIATAIVLANRLTGENAPIATCMRQPSRARNVAMKALMEAFPAARRESIARCCGLAKTTTIHAVVIQAAKASWWREDWIDEIVGTLMADAYPD